MGDFNMNDEKTFQKILANIRPDLSPLNKNLQAIIHNNIFNSIADFFSKILNAKTFFLTLSASIVIFYALYAILLLDGSTLAGGEIIYIFFSSYVIISILRKFKKVAKDN